MGSFIATQQLEAIYDESSESLELVVQKGCERPIILSVQSQAGQGFEQPNLVKDILAHGSRVGLDDL